MTEKLKWEWSAMTNCTKKEALDYIGERNNLNAELKEARGSRRKLLIDFLEYFDGGIVEDIPKSEQAKNYYYPINEIDDFLNQQSNKEEQK